MKFYENVIKTLFFYFLLSLLAPLVKAENSSYSLIIYSNSNVLNPNDLCEIGVFVPGEGKIDLAKVSVIIPHELARDGYIRSFKPEPICNDYCCTGFDLSNENWIVYTSKMYAILRKDYFKPMCSIPDSLLSEYSIRIMDTNKLYTPINIRFNISKNVNPGDYSLKFILFYKDGNNWYQDEDTIKIHVNNFYEQYELGLWVLGFFIVSLTLIVEIAMTEHWNLYNLFKLFFLILLIIFIVFIFIVLFSIF
jgi:hypothetical protein